MPAAMLSGTMPHRFVSAENPERVIPLEPKVVEYRCERCELTTTVRLHPEAAVPASWACRRCREAAECMQKADEDAEVIGLGRGARTYTPKDHWTQLSERRTEEELQRLLDARLALLRAGTLRSGPSYR